MKSAAFDYHAPTSEAQALELLALHGEEGRILAGGQSLVPSMAFRMARPGVLIDINRIASLAHVTPEGGVLRIGALARHAWFEKPVVPGPLGALLAQVAQHIAHTPIRMRGTFCGSIAHADPASEWCCTALMLDAAMVCTSAAGGRRVVPARDWFQAVFTTALASGEMLAEVRLPLLGPEWRCGFAEFSRRAGDFALAMAAVRLRLDAAGLVQEAVIALGGIGGTPVLAGGAAAALVGERPEEAAFTRAAEIAAAECDPQEDIHASAEYRRDLVRAMLRRALRKAVAS